ncbi:glutathione S-transferase family protein [Filomicrobium sp.]|uniref:glutathione S-transferase family protein n=1 Tax=Filomicrobium sp. TaxID=2024831 RepID=UPI0025882B26|nr:glutathione S-transferase family protein [Filomicrobium sp.]MCV0371129.1 glutathione S-transferase family protein [Filomicrobium sp.]
MTEVDPPIEIYWVSGSPFGWRVLLMAEFKSVPYLSHRIDTASGKQKSAAYLALNPRGKVPALVHGNVIIGESLAMMTYLERLFPEPPMFGATAVEAAHIMQICSEFVCYLEPVINRLSTAISRNKSLSAAALTARHGTLHTEFKRLNELLQKSQWLTGNSLSAADLTVYPHCKFLLRLAARPAAVPLNLGLSDFADLYPDLTTWMQRFEALPGYDKAYPPHWRETG